MNKIHQLQVDKKSEKKEKLRTGDNRRTTGGCKPLLFAMIKWLQNGGSWLNSVCDCVFICVCVCVRGRSVHVAHTRIPSPLALAQNCRLSSALRVWLKFHFFIRCPGKSCAIFFPDLVPGKITFAQRLPLAAGNMKIDAASQCRKSYYGAQKKNELMCGSKQTSTM